MTVLVNDGGERRPVGKMSMPQLKQAAAIMDCIGRLIPQEGVDYDVEIVFKGDYNPSVSMAIKPLTDKGERWKSYVMEMIKKYPPKVGNPDQAIDEAYAEQEVDDEVNGGSDEEVVS